MFSCLAILIVLIGLFPGPADTAVLTAGDLAPYGAPDNALNVADLVILQRMVNDELIPSPAERLVADVAPLGSPDGQLNAADLLILQRAILGTIVLDPIVTTPVAVQISSSIDDVEERFDGTIATTSSDLELVLDGAGNQTVGMRFTDIYVPQGATILDAYIQFTTDEPTSGITTLSIEGEAHDNAPLFTNTDFNVSSRQRTAAAVPWSPPPWLTVGEASIDQQTPDLSPIIQEIVDRPGWQAGNSLAFLVTGTGERVALSFNGSPAGAPTFHVEYAGLPINLPPLVDAGLDSGIVLPTNNIALNGTVVDDGLPGGMLITTWSHVGGTGAGTVSFDDASLLNTTATFTQDPGSYILRLTADDTELLAFDELTVLVDVQGAVASISQTTHFLTGYTPAGIPRTIPSIDPAGISFHDTSSRLFLSDSEINEVMPVWDVIQANVFETSLAGDILFAQYDLTQNPGNQSFRNLEPTGITFCTHDNHFYFTNDDAKRVYRTSYDGSSFLTTDVVSTLPSANDPEGISCDPTAQRLYVITGGIRILVYSYNSGFVLEQVIDLVTTAGDPAGIPSDPEGIAFDSVSGHLFVVSDPDEAIFEYTINGVFIKKFDISGYTPSPISPQGLAIGPASVNPGELSFYIADAGVDNDIDPNERDGIIFEALILRAP